MTPTEIAAWLTAAVAATALLGIAWRWTRRVSRFLDDWFGHDDRPGVPQRLERVEGRLETVEYELHPNRGESLRDAVNRIEEQTGREPR